jgi:hypothetical protein
MSEASHWCVPCCNCEREVPPSDLWHCEGGVRAALDRALAKGDKRGFRTFTPLATTCRASGPASAAGLPRGCRGR